ncbi:MAG: ferredoxin--NADP reductase [Acidobacteria bacterium]|nr:ferredoxin--NADP reductase [Acidobacteriota bacterium]
MRVAPSGWHLPAFTPGQFAVLGLPGSAPRHPLADAVEDPLPEADKLIRRSYSIASGSVERDELEFFVTMVRSGALTPRLFALGVGDPLWLGPKITGSFTLDEVPAGQDLVLVATGTGLAPYMSMLRSGLLHGPPRKTAVLLGARHSWDLGYREELEVLARAFDAFTFHPTVSRPGEEPLPWTGHTGYVQDLWTRGVVAEAWGSRPSSDTCHFLLCGNPAMIEDMTKLLTEEGFREHKKREPGQIHAEKYW